MMLFFIRAQDLTTTTRIILNILLQPMNLKILQVIQLQKKLKSVQEKKDLKLRNSLLKIANF